MTLTASKSMHSQFYFEFYFLIRFKDKKISPTGIRTLEPWAMKPELSDYTNDSHSI
jgi:hypothetical protein